MLIATTIWAVIVIVFIRMPFTRQEGENTVDCDGGLATLALTFCKQILKTGNNSRRYFSPYFQRIVLLLGFRGPHITTLGMYSSRKKCYEPWVCLDLAVG